MPLSQDPKYKDGAKAVPDVAEAPGGHIWDVVRKHGLSYRNYGFFLSDEIRDGSTIVIPDNYPKLRRPSAGRARPCGVSDVDFRRFDLNYPDSEARLMYAKKTGDDKFLRPMRGFGKFAAPSRYSEWKREFDQMLAKAPDGSPSPIS